MYQGDQYWVKMNITKDGSAVTPDTDGLIGVRVNINDDEIVKEWAAGDGTPVEDGVKYDDAIESWELQILEEDSLSLSNKFKIQIRLKYTGTNDTVWIYTSKPIEAKMGRSIFMEEYDV